MKSAIEHIVSGDLLVKSKAPMMQYFYNSVINVTNFTIWSQGENLLF